MTVRDIIGGTIGGGSALAPTGNPWLIGAGIIGGGLLGAFDSGSELSPEEEAFNRLTLQQQQQNLAIGDISLRNARRLASKELQANTRRRNIGKQLGGLFRALPKR